MVAQSMVDGTLEGRRMVPAQSSSALMQYFVVGVVVLLLGLWYISGNSAPSWAKRALQRELSAVAIPGLAPYDAGAQQALFGKGQQTATDLDDFGLPTGAAANYGSGCGSSGTAKLW